MFDEGRESVPRFSINGSEAKENFKVVIRVRPPLPREVDPEYGFSSVVEISPDSKSISLLEYLGAASNDLEREQDLEQNPALANYHCFTFDHVYDPESPQSLVYENTARPAVYSTLEGYNATLIAYGQTGTGKTYTMEGFRFGVNDSQRGIVPRSIEDVFSYIESSSNADSTFMVRVSYLQIYNENISDLLKNERGPLQIREEKRRGVFVEGLSEWAVRTPSEITSLLEKGANARATASTKMNDISSRSHAVFIIIVEQMKLEDEFKQVKMGKLNIVDLAGSERVRVTGATGKRLEESKKINQSLSALGNVISALTDSKPRTHIPYRDSKLTRLLEDSLGGNCKTTMFAMISPAHDAFSESLSTLKFANRAKNIKNAPRVNEDVDQKALLRKYENELQKLRSELDHKNRVVVDMQRLLEIEKEKKRTEDYRESLDQPLKDFLIEQEEKKKLEERIKIMNSQLLPGGKKIEDTPQFRSALEEKQRAIRNEYEVRLQEIEKERQQIEEDKAQIDRYKQLLLRQRDIMIALTARLNERDETIIQLQEELDAYDRLQKETEEALDNKQARCEQLEHLCVRYGIHVPAEENSRVFSSKDKKLYPPTNTNSYQLDSDSVVPLQMLTADEKILELTHIINEQKQEIEELQETQASISRDEIEYLRRENYDLEVKLSGISAEVEKYTKEKQSLTGLVEGNLFRLLEQMQTGLQEGSYHQGSLSQDINRLLKAASIFRSVLRGEELPKENQPPDRSTSPFKPDIKTNGRTRPLTVDEMIMIKKQEMRKAREGM